MQHGHILKKMKFDVLKTPPWSGGGGGSAGKYLLPCCCIPDFHYFSMQQDHVLKKLNLDILTPRAEESSGDKIFATILQHSCFPLI